MARDRRRRIAPVDLLLALAVVVTVTFLGWQLWHATRVDALVTGIKDHGAVTLERSGSMDVRVDVHPRGRLDGSVLALDGADLKSIATRTKLGFEWRSDKPMAAGMHKLVLTVPRPILPASRFVWSFLVDAVPPRINVGRTLLAPIAIDAPVTVRGTVDTDSTLTANGDQVDVAADGAFRVSYKRAPAGPITLVAVDRAGQTTIKEIFVPIRRPVTHGVHMSAISWSNRDLRAAVLDLADRGLINTVELDIKDEDGIVGWNTTVPLARKIGAVRAYYDLRDAVKQLHARKLRVIGRAVAFRDPVLARAAWSDGNRDWVLQDVKGQPLGAYGGFTNFMSAGVRKYNIDLAMEAVDLGVDEILWDYVRRPEDKKGVQMVIPGLRPNDSVEAQVAAFLTEAHVKVRSAGALQGASVFGIAAKEPETIGQSVPLIAKAVDYIAPMVYPSLWVPSYYHVPDPPRMPFAIVTRALEDFQNQSKSTGVTIVPWLQDFSLGANYGADQVRAQVDAANGLGIKSFLLWSPRVKYHADTLDPIKR
ncbi:MAG: hypothetical protein QOI47_1852 [Actinomycetota bacterium]|nr:hypothetical protein [Actinomycetota bacterium]